MGARVVSIDEVAPSAYSSSIWAVRKMRAVLEKQGQIEPLQVRRVHNLLLVWEEDAWGNEIVFAARDLKWDTLLVVETEKFEE